MAKKKDDIPEWVANHIQNAKFADPVSESKTGYILEIYDKDLKLDIQLYEPVEDGRHIVTMDMASGIDPAQLQKGVVYNFSFDQSRAPLDKKVVEYLSTEKEIDMKAIYRFDLKTLEVIDEGATDAGPDASL